MVPAAIPVTRPGALTVATEGIDEFQLPPRAASLSSIVDPAHTVPAPLMVPAFGVAFTVTTLVTYTLPQPFVTV